MRDIQELIDTIKEQPLESWSVLSMTDPDKPSGCVLNYAGEVLGYGKAFLNVWSKGYKEYDKFLEDFGLSHLEAGNLVWLNDRDNDFQPKDREERFKKVKEDVLTYLMKIRNQMKIRNERLKK
jgi:hypothetical protein